MAKVQTPHEKVGKTVVKKETNPKSKPNHQTRNTYCILCRRLYLKHEAQEHMHGMLHHRELETVLGKDSFHECQACKASSMGLNEYAQHISTTQHKDKLKILMFKNVKPSSLYKTLSRETVSRILERNKTLKKEEKKIMKKKKKKLKQVAGQRAAVQLATATKTKVASKELNPEKSKKVNMRTLKRMQETHQIESNHAVVQNKENKMSSLKRPLHQSESTLQSQNRRLICLPGEPKSRTWNHPYPQDHLRNDDNFSVINQCSKVKIERSQTDIHVKRPHNTQGSGTSTPEQLSWPAISRDCYNGQYDTEFTSDHLPQNGAIVINHDQDENARASQPGPEQAAHPANTSANAAPIRDVDVNSMLRQIRRALGVREPCRADREARKQSSEAGGRVADHSTAQQAGTGKEQLAGGSFRNHNNEAALYITSAADASVQSPQVNTSAPATQTTSKTTQGMTQHWERSSVVVCDSDGLSNSSEIWQSQGASPFSVFDSLASLGGCQTTSTEPNRNITCKVRIAHKSGKVQGEKEDGLKPTLQKLLTLSGASSKLSWREMYGEMKRRKQDKINGMPRFGIELVNPFSDQEGSAQAEDNDMLLSEGFHWESFPDGPPSTHLPPPQNTTDNDSHTETQSSSRMQVASVGQPASTQDCSSQTVAAAPVKVEPNLEDENRDLRNDSSANKRKHKSVRNDGISDMEPGGKKKKTKSHKDQGQMDQLLAVSLREEELSHSLQDLDKSLIQARNALQAAYTEVQRLLLLRQQFTAEVNSLRAKRIEILQGMQEGYSGASNMAEKATTSSAGAADTAQPRISSLSCSSVFATSSSQLPSATNPTSSISQPPPTSLALPTISVKREICQPPSAQQTSQLSQTVSFNADTPQVPLFPSDLLLLSPPHLAASTTATTSSKQLRPGCSSSVNTPPSAESSYKQQEHVPREGLKGSIKRESLAREEASPIESDSEEEMEGHISNKQVKGKELIAENSTFVPERHKNTPAAASDNDGGNESDNSVEMMEPSDLVVIDIDESDNEGSPEPGSNVPAQQEPPQKSVSVEFSSARACTSQQNVERKFQPVKEVNIPPESVQPVEDEEPFLGAFVNHTGPVHGLQIHEGYLYTCSGDNTARAYSLVNGDCQAVFEGHTNKVNCLLVSSLPNMPVRLYTGSSDQTICCYSIKSKKCLEQIPLPDRVLCLHIAWNILYAGLANGSVASHDLKTLKQLDVFECHGPRGVSCLGTAQEGARRVLLVGSYDSTISVRDAKSGLLLRSLQGHTKTVLCMKVVNDLVFSGSSDTSVHAHNIHTGELVRIYKGHGHAVTSIVILGKVMVTACLDKLVRVYELQSHDRLQVYGGHSDMVMCMAVHKSVIYTGCYDGSVKAVKLNLMKNFRCWWQNCSLIFGMAEHLKQHLIGDHSNPNLQTVKCRWRGCSTFFSTQQLVRQELPKHMQSHVEKDSKVQP
ncbi:zinc finger protein 106 isoform X1 [Thunnus thynnus]|uniref:zinc finger protein 106 isoform X1 n=1 Tax=Thunnus thynnus TaxID=8237 RepID=UPI003526CB1D